jgi:hypothetical protein
MPSSPESRRAGGHAADRKGKIVTRTSIAAAAAASLLGFASPAAAQMAAAIIPDVIGATVGNMAAGGAVDVKCLLNERPAEPAAVAEARAGAEAAMRDYMRLAAASPKADVTAAFTRKASLRFWLRHGKDTFATQIEDPFAHDVAAGRATMSKPLAFVRSGNGATAIGLWRVESGAAGPLAHYRANFRRESKAWRITRMDLVEPPAEPDPLAYYCNVPGDSEAYAKAVAERDAKRERKRAARAAQRESEAAPRQGRRGG